MRGRAGGDDRGPGSLTPSAAVAVLAGPGGAEALRDAAAALLAAAGNRLAAATALRAAGYPAELAAPALTQAVLRDRARAKFGPAADHMFFTGVLLEQATRAAVAQRRAARLALSGVSTVTDLGCGLGADTLAFARAGLAVTAVDADPAAAALTEANAAALGLADRVQVRQADAAEVALDAIGAVFADPARRGPTGRRVFDPDRWSPPWSFLLAVAAEVPHTVLKVGPGIDHARLPPTAEAEWVSVGRELVEATIWCGPLAAVPRRATYLGAGGTAELTGSGTRTAPTGPLCRYLYDPAGAVTRAHLVAELADRLAATLVDPTIAYLTSGARHDTPFATRYEVLDAMPFSLKRLRAALRARGVGRVTITKRGSAVDVDRLRQDLRLSGTGTATVVLTRVAGAPTAILCAAD